MADVTVFVDQAVQGRFPGVCVIDGVDTADTLVVRQEIGDGARLGAAWLLVLAGPLGWVGLLVIAAMQSGRAEVLSVRVPFSSPAHQRLRAARRLVRTGCAGAVAGVVLAAVVAVADWAAAVESALFGAALAAVVVGIVVALVGQWRVGRHTIDVHLDASRRWVTLGAVHGRFARAAGTPAPDGVAVRGTHPGG